MDARPLEAWDFEKAQRRGLIYLKHEEWYCATLKCNGAKLQQSGDYLFCPRCGTTIYSPKGAVYK